MADISVFDRIITVDDTINNKFDTNNVVDINGGTGGAETSQEFAQGFTAMSNSVKAVSIKFWKWNTPTDNIIVKLTSSLGGAALASATIAASAISAGSLRRIVFSSPATVTPGTTYYIEVSRDGARDTTNKCAVYIDFQTSMFPGGNLYQKTNNAWGNDPNYLTTDFHFTVDFAENPVVVIPILNISVSETITVYETFNDTTTTLYLPISQTITVTEVIALEAYGPRFWIGGSGNWSDVSHWAMTSGGTGGAAFPIYLSSATFDSNSFSADGQTVTIDRAAECSNLDFSAINHTVNLTFTSGFDMEIYNGNLILSPLLTVNDGPGNNNFYTYSDPGYPITINTYGITLPVYIEAYADDDVTLASDLIFDNSNGFYFAQNNNSFLGHLYTNGYNITGNDIEMWDTDTGMTLGDTIITLIGSFPYLDIECQQNFDAGTSKIVANATSGQSYMYFYDQHMYDFEQLDSNTAFDGHSYWRNITFKDGSTVQLDGSNPTYVEFTGTLTWPNTTQATLSSADTSQGYLISSSDVTVSKVSIQRIIANSAVTWNATNGSVDNGFNAGWTFDWWPNKSDTITVSESVSIYPQTLVLNTHDSITVYDGEVIGASIIWANRTAIPASSIWEVTHRESPANYIPRDPYSIYVNDNITATDVKT